MTIPKKIGQAAFQWLGLGVTHYDTLVALKEYKNSLDLVLAMQRGDLSRVPMMMGQSKSQLKQDFFALTESGFKRNGYFVEFGATDGVQLSNSYLLEKEYGWSGILAEPARCWHQALRANRNSWIETNCVWRDSDSVVKFNEVDDAALSTIAAFKDADGHSRHETACYEVKTISLNDLLAKYDAPREIDYLSIDTEGSEFEILRNFDFTRHRFKVITCEHNFTPMRENLFELLSENGYVRKHIELSRWDDWYVHQD